MKKTVWCIFLVFVLIFCGCAAEVNEPVPEPTEEPVGGMMGVPNPLSASSLEELEKELGCVLALPSDTFSELSVTRINVDPVLYSLDFVYEGTPYQFRLQKGSEMTDISGMYFQWAERYVSEDPACEIAFNEGSEGICLWQKNGMNFSLGMDTDADRGTLASMYEVLSAVCEK